MGPLHVEGCLFCRSTDGGFNSREHVFPEALGNTEHVLDAGIVCDRCNNGPLGTCDGALVNYQPIAFRRTVLRVTGKRRTVPDSKWGNATLSHAEPGRLVIDEREDAQPTVTQTGANSFRLTLKSAGPMRAGTVAKMSRSIWKSTIEFIYIDQGPGAAFDERYDEVRAMIAGAQAAHGVLIIARTGDPDVSDVSLTYTPEVGRDGRDRVFVHANYFGLEMGTELLVREVENAESAQGRADILVF